MTLAQAQKFTTKFTVLLTTALLLFFTVLLMIGETQGDFANGILFFLAGMINPITMIYMIILYSLTYFQSRKATIEIIEKNRKPWLVSLSISVFISLVTVAYFFTWWVIKLNDSRPTLPVLGLLEPVLRLFLSTVIFEFLIWIWATTRTKKLKIDTHELEIQSR